MSLLYFMYERALTDGGHVSSNVAMFLPDQAVDGLKPLVNSGFTWLGLKGREVGDKGKGL